MWIPLLNASIPSIIEELNDKTILSAKNMKQWNRRKTHEKITYIAKYQTQITRKNC